MHQDRQGSRLCWRASDSFCSKFRCWIQRFSRASYGCFLCLPREKLPPRFQKLPCSIYWTQALLDLRLTCKTQGRFRIHRETLDRPSQDILESVSQCPSSMTFRSLRKILINCHWLPRRNAPSILQSKRLPSRKNCQLDGRFSNTNSSLFWPCSALLPFGPYSAFQSFTSNQQRCESRLF